MNEKIIILEDDFKSKFKKFEKIIKNEKNENKNKFKDYFFGFINTFSNIFIISSIIDLGKIKLFDKLIPSSILSFIVSLIPFVSNGISTEIKSIGDFFEKINIKENYSKKILKISNNTEAFTQLVGKTIIKILENKNKRKEIFSVNEKITQANIDNIFIKIANVFKEILKDIDKKLYGQTYNNPARRLGNFHANLIIKKYMRDEFVNNCIYEDEFSNFIINYNDEKNDLSSEENNCYKCSQICPDSSFFSCACLIF